MLVTDAVATALTELGAPRHAETTRSRDMYRGSHELLGAPGEWRLYAVDVPRSV